MYLTEFVSAESKIIALLLPWAACVFFVTASPIPAASQGCAVGAIAGDRMGYRLRISEPNNMCTCANVYTLPYTLHLLESGSPSLRFTSNGPAQAPACIGDVHATLSLNAGGPGFSSLEAVNDFSIVVDQSAANLILSTRDPGSSIKFATTHPNGGPDVERMRITDLGRIAIGTTNAHELVQIGEFIAFHDGGGKFLGFNAYYDGANFRNVVCERISATVGVSEDIVPPSQTFEALVLAVDQDAVSSGTVFESDFKGIAIQSNGTVGVGERFPDALLQIHAPASNTYPMLHITHVVSSVERSALRITSMGEVVIGDNLCSTSIPTENIKLHVDGAAVAKEFFVTLDDWPDYVFEKGYELMSLAEVKRFISNNGHLPGIPTSQNVQHSGVGIGTMNAKLLEKIEELTLYLVQLSEQNTALEERLAKLEGIPR